jgi:hypothetical protein
MKKIVLISAIILIPWAFFRLAEADPENLVIQLLQKLENNDALLVILLLLPVILLVTRWLIEPAKTVRPARSNDLKLSHHLHK